MPHHLALLDSPTADITDMVDPLDLAWLALHERNIAAHRAGRDAAALAAVSGTGAVNPYKLDEHYWFNEGLHGRPFVPITDQAALVLIAAQQSANHVSA